MAERRRVATAIGEPVQPEGRVGDKEITFGQPPLILQMQPPYGYIELETPEELKQWEEDLRNFYGITLDANSAEGLRCCHTCSGGCFDDCGIMR
jgi:hypothetical protein